MDARGAHVIAAYPRLAESSRVGSARGPHDLQTSLIDRLMILYAFENLGGCSRTRTCDPLIKSQLLYQLSYAPLAGGGRYISKRPVVVEHATRSPQDNCRALSPEASGGRI